MKSLIPLSLLLASSFSSAFIIPGEQQLAAFVDTNFAESDASEKRLIELSPGDQKWVTEAEKLELKRAGKTFFDITDHRDFGSVSALGKKSRVTFPSELAFADTITPLLAKLNSKNMKSNLEKFTSFFTRYYKSDYGRESSEWLLSQVNATANGLETLRLAPFPHYWPQSSIIACIPGKSERTVVIGAHQDSINLWLPSLLAAPGADDDGSGTVTILEAFRVITEYLKETGTQLEQTLEFHWYSAEEGGLLGSQAIFSSYERAGRDVVAMLQQDMTGYVKGTLRAGKPEAVGVITDYVDPGLTNFIKRVVKKYCAIGYVETKCGYACSDHASASKAGYPSAFVIESEFDDSDQKIHTTEDKISELSFEHMREHAKMTLAFALELALTKTWSAEAGELEL